VGLRVCLGAVAERKIPSLLLPGIELRSSRYLEKLFIVVCWVVVLLCAFLPTFLCWTGQGAPKDEPR